jgi:DNA helicase IV
MDRVVEHLVASDDSEMLVMSMLRGADLQAALVNDSALPSADPDVLAGPFAHVIVDEAQELTDAEWQMVLRRCPSRSVTVVGDRAQARRGFPESWRDRLHRVGFDDVRMTQLTVNYRTPREVMAEAEPIIRAVLPDANVPISIRTGGTPVRYGSAAELDELIEGWLADHLDGTACVIAARDVPVDRFRAGGRVRSLPPEVTKGLEFDLVVLIDPDEFGSSAGGIGRAVDRYVAMTRATRQLVVLAT